VDAPAPDPESEPTQGRPTEPIPAPEAERADRIEADSGAAPEPEQPAEPEPEPQPDGDSPLAPEPEPGGEPAAPATPPAPPRSRRPAGAVGVAIAVLLIGAVAFAGSRILVPGSAASPLETHMASAAATPSANPLTTASAPNVASASPTPAPVRTAVPTPTESLPPQTAPTATITFNELVVYPKAAAATNPAGFRFVSDGPGPVTASVVASAPTDSSQICLSGDGGTPICTTGATPTVTFYSQSIQSKWVVTLGSANEASPTIDVQLSWPSNKPSITAAGFPFEGSPNRDSLRSLTATLTARESGEVTISADWAPASLTASLTAWLVGKSGQTVAATAAFGPSQAMPATARLTVKTDSTYRITLMDTGAGAAAQTVAETVVFP